MARKLSEDDVKEILKRRARGEPLQYIGMDYGVSRQTILLICRGQLWGNVPRPQRSLTKGRPVMSRCSELRLLSVSDLSKLFQRSEGWIRSQVKAGKLPCLRMGQSLRFEPAQIEEYLKDKRQNAY